MYLGKTLNDNFQTGILCGVEDKHRCLFHNGKYQRKQKIKTSGCGTASISLIAIYDISAQVKLGAGQTRRKSNSAQVKLGAGQTRRRSNSAQVKLGAEKK